MQYFAVPLLLAVCAAPAVAQQAVPPVRSAAAVLASPARATVWGQVRSEKTGAPLRNAIVELVTPTREEIAAVTDSAGVYVLNDVPAGRRLLRATHIDHAPNEAEMLVVAGDRQTLDFDLEFRPIRLSPVTAQGNRVFSVETALDTTRVLESDLGPASLRVVESTPGVAELGLAEVARDVPGQPVDPTDVLYVRGGAADLKLVLLNGVPVYAPFHIGGLIHALDADVLRSATLYMGGAPARYDGGLSYVMELETRSARTNGLHGTAALDMMAGKALIEGPIGPYGSVLMAGRVVHGEGTSSWIGDPFPYAYADGLARGDLRLAREHLVTVTGFWNRERVNLDTLAGVRQSATWGNHAGSVRYRGRAAGHDVLGTVAVSRFRTTLPLGGIQPLLTEGTANRTRVAVDLERSLGRGRLYWGGSFDQIRFEYRAFQAQGSRDDNPYVASEADGSIAGAYAEATIAPLPRVRLRGGVRADVFSREPELGLAPRFSATVLLTDRVALTLAGGRYRQYVRAPERSLVFLGDVVPDSTGDSSLTVAEATHLVLGLAQDFGEGIRLGLEGYFKQFEGLHFARAKKTESSGVDLWVRRGSGSLTGWLGYSLAWIWTIEDERRATQSFAGRQLVSAGLAGPIMGRGNFDVRVSYGAGLPYTAIPEPETASPVFGASLRMHGRDLDVPDVAGLPEEPQQPYVRVDAQLQRTFSGEWRNFDFEVTPYVKVINALNRRDAIFYHYNRDVGHAEPIAGLPLVPIVGLEWKF